MYWASNRLENGSRRQDAPTPAGIDHRSVQSKSKGRTQELGRGHSGCSRVPWLVKFNSKPFKTSCFDQLLMMWGRRITMLWSCGSITPRPSLKRSSGALSCDHKLVLSLDLPVKSSCSWQLAPLPSSSWHSPRTAIHSSCISPHPNCLNGTMGIIRRPMLLLFASFEAVVARRQRSGASEPGPSRRGRPHPPHVMSDPDRQLRRDSRVS